MAITRRPTTTTTVSTTTQLATTTPMPVYNVTEQSAELDITAYIEQSCSEAVNRLVAGWIVQVLNNLTNYTVSETTNATSALNNVDPLVQTLDSLATLGPQLLQTALVKLLTDNDNVKTGVEAVLTNSPTFGATVYDKMVAPIKNNTNIFFLLTMGIFIYFMQTGFALMEVGLVRTKNTGNSVWKNVSYSFSSALGYWLCGMALSLGETEGRFAGKTFWAFKDMPAATGQGVDLMYFFFEYVFCTTAGAVMTGAIAERAQIGCYIIFTLLASAFTYPVVVHWCWDVDGWLKYGALYDINGQEVRIGYEDFAGSGVVHACGGVAALVGIIFIGPRIGRFLPNGEVVEFQGHSLPFVGAGAMTLFTGFLAFNAGSETAISNEADALPVNRAAVNTICCGIGGFLTVGLLYRIYYKRWLAIPMLCGGLAGNVAACCNCAVVEAWASFCIGILAGAVFIGVSYALRRLKIDDAADAVGVHWGGGFAGCVGLALFKINVGILYNWDKQSGIVLGWQLLGFTVISLWSASHTWVMFYIMKMFNMVRVDPESELVGLDYAHGHELPYPGVAYQIPNVCPGGEEHHAGLSEEEMLEKMYDKLFETEMAKYTVEYINKPGWSHPVLGGVWYDLSWISIVRSRRKEMEKRRQKLNNGKGHGSNGIVDQATQFDLRTSNQIGPMIVQPAGQRQQPQQDLQLQLVQNDGIRQRGNSSVWHGSNENIHIEQHNGPSASPQQQRGSVSVTVAAPPPVVFPGAVASSPPPIIIDGDMSSNTQV